MNLPKAFLLKGIAALLFALLSACVRFAAEAARRLGKEPPAIDPGVMVVLRSYAWPGNVRELRHVIERAVFLFQADPLQIDHLPVEVTNGAAPPNASPARVPKSSASGVPDERQRILDALAQAAGHQGRAAEARVLLEEAITLARAAEMRSLEHSYMCNLGTVLVAEGDRDGAYALFTASLAGHRATG